MLHAYTNYYYDDGIRIMIWVRHIARTGDEKLIQILVGKREETRQFERLQYRGKDSIRLDFEDKILVLEFWFIWLRTANRNYFL
jgi:hypothetical protein